MIDTSPKFELLEFSEKEAKFYNALKAYYKRAVSLEIWATEQKYKYRKLPKELSAKARAFYGMEKLLNGFHETKELRIDGDLVARKYERVVIGDYGAYIEFAPEDLLVVLDVPINQRWRFNEEYIKQRGLSIKYRWLEYKGRKVYLQVNTVTYADYKPGMYYISVQDAD